MKWVSDKVSEWVKPEEEEKSAKVGTYKNRTEPTRRRRRRNLRQTKMVNDKVSERQLWQTAAPESERENWDELRGERRICGRRGRRLLGTAESKKPLQKGEQQTVMTRWLLLMLMKLLTKFHFFLFFFIVLLCTCHLISILSLSPPHHHLKLLVQANEKYRWHLQHQCLSLPVVRSTVVTRQALLLLLSVSDSGSSSSSSAQANKV